MAKDWTVIRQYPLIITDNSLDKHNSLDLRMSNQPEFATGKICYLVIPAINIEESAVFFESTFGWHLRRENGTISFDDSVNQVSGTWVAGLPAHTNPGISIHIMVMDMDAALQTVTINGGKIVTQVGKDLPEITAEISDPAGNLFGLYQHRG